MGIQDPGPASWSLAPSHHVLTWRKGGGALWDLSAEGTNPIHEGSALKTQSSPKCPAFQHHHLWELGFQCTDLWGEEGDGDTNIQAPAGTGRGNKAGSLSHPGTQASPPLLLGIWGLTLPHLPVGQIQSRAGAQLSVESNVREPSTAHPPPLLRVLEFLP